MTQVHEMKELKAPEQEPAAPSPASKVRYVTWGMYAGAILAICAFALIALLSVSHESVPALLESVRRAGRFGTIFQAGLGVWAVLRWRRLVAWLRTKGIVRKHEHRRVLALRTKTACAMALYLLLVPIGPIALLQLAQSFFR